MQKSALQYVEIIFQSKVILLFLPKCSKLHHSEMYTIMVYCIPYNGRDCREEEKKTKHGEMRWTPKQ